MAEFRYVVVPAFITSKMDGDRHYIGADKLMRLYGVDPRECLILDYRGDIIEGTIPKDVIWLTPRYHGDYEGYVERSRRKSTS